MKVTIDASRCEGRGYCARFAPTVFDRDEDGYGRVTVRGEVPEEAVTDARSAASACPEQAITLHE
ncbi:ferredoxin [Dactylosporangium roseum]|uniref:Ferredoxin n=1 Tax=Dactylosporangium roseum TaxID=47989 RepID=A0ABY5ZAQ5_9ACTN|nr:ferredoxin [Dactylosporangium roseum]UWZ39101.1 ferredoxin [Dactylosporangium roseum]